ncbi:aminopeptidase [Neptunitalea chrysea]|uniref:Aminopeptidase N n=1 Tax=Neptunitalea chrysea TaxID=1647581 RepID=A0A9W6B4K3_9FLAO|nr:M1 family metallopeptidase [Neptunitalea chrysea]GLB52420.1 aminopeptidase [Neptunitalea chrysea]
MNYKGFIFFITVFFVSLSFAQQTSVADFKTANVKVTINPYTQMVNGTVDYTVDIVSKTDTLYLDAQHTDFVEVTWNGKKIKYDVTDHYLILRKKLKPKNNNVLRFTYSVKPRKTMYFVGWDYEGARKQVWTQGQGKYTSNWLPSFDDVNEKVIFNISVIFSSDYSVITNGVLKDKKQVSDSLTKWNYQMTHPMSSYLVAIAIGDYDYHKLISNNGKEMLLYYYPDMPSHYEPTYRYSKQIFDFLENEIGVPFVWGNYKQIPVADFMYGGMENTTATLFNDGYYIDSLAFVDKNYVNVNAHELAHQWFGDLITEATPSDHWLQEGFATYYALLAEKDVFGDDYFKAALFETAIQLKYQSDKGEGENLLNAKASSLTFYQKGAWALVALENELGHTNFKKGITAYLEKYKFKNVTTNQFLAEMESASGKDLANFKERWLLKKEFLYDEAMELLADKPYSLPELINEKFKDTLADKVTETSKKLWNSLSPEYKEKVITYRYDALVDSFYIKSILNDKNVLVRQSYLVQTTKIPSYLEPEFEKFLLDKSYNTIENVLYKLWVNFPEKRKEYLAKTENVKGTNDLNVRILWLVLALSTPEFKQSETLAMFQELSGFTSPVYGYSVREKAFGFLEQMDTYTNENLKDLVNGCLYSSWRFASNCRTILDRLLKDPIYKERIEKLMPDLTQKEQKFLKKKL